MSHYYHYWSKTAPKEDLETLPAYHLLVYHSLDVAAVMQILLTPGNRLSTDMANQTGLSEELIQFLFTVSMVLHDFGKFSKAFQALDLHLFQHLLPGSHALPYTERHDTLGFLLWRGDPGGAFGNIRSTFDRKDNRFRELLEPLIKPSSGHHGVPPKESASSGGAPLFASSFFDVEDLTAAQHFLSECLQFLGDPPHLPELTKPHRKRLKEASWSLAGLAVIADWTGSNSDYFPFHTESMDISTYWTEIALPQAETALKTIGWNRARPRHFSVESSVQQLFPFISTPTPLQTQSTQMEIPEGPQLFILEDVTGAGKTEAAMILTARLMAAGSADGVYIGLPTMATANAMYLRMQDAYRTLYRNDERPSLVLSHGKRHLSSSFTESVVAHGQPVTSSYENEEPATATCNAWYADNRKKALLADVGVGTIDQALISVLPARHQSVRLLGLRRKVLIVDEVHAYDAYMNRLLAVLLEGHSRGGGSAILLSATIPNNKRRELIGAFRKGLSPSNDPTVNESESQFPLMTRAGVSSITSHPVQTRVEVKRSVSATFIHSYHDVLSLIAEIRRAGKCVCWVRNTVRDARKTFMDIARHGSPSKEMTTLFHSRFAMVDRARIETDVLNRFGKRSSSHDRAGRVVIATQVVEQSLDLDFDFMITDLAPIDLVVQRAGRLRRHARTADGDPVSTAKGVEARGPATIHIFAPEFDNDADASWLSGEFAGTEAVYQNPGVLWRTQKKLSTSGGWRMPDDARSLIESVYGEDALFDVPPGLDDKTIRAIGKDQSKDSMGYLNSLILERGYSRDSVGTEYWNEDDKVSTRISSDSREIVLATVDDGVLVPYADTEHDQWDWSSLSVSDSAWKQAAYEVPSNCKEMVGELKQNNRRLMHSEIVIVANRASESIRAVTAIANCYDPHLGWGTSDVQEV